jgi:hypothetical protein|tara:strand:- start:2052 stop:2225 length:174 start_codon:yes stop_codon:yes gene_type:complete
MNKKKKRFKDLFKDLIFNNPKADKQIEDDPKEKALKKRMLYDHIREKPVQYLILGTL